MKKILLAVLAAVIMLSFPQLSVSEINEGSIEISPFAGYYFLSEHDRNRGGVGLGGGYNFTKNWGLEGAYDYAGKRAGFLRADVLYHLIPEGAFNPFIFAGVGNAHMKPHDDSYNHILGEVGAGFKYFLSDNFAIRADIRDIQEKYNNVAVTAGLVFAFGGKAKQSQSQAWKPVGAKPGPKAEEKVVVPAAETKAEEKIPAPASKAKIIEDKVIVLALEDVHFDLEKSTLTEEAQVILKRNIRILKENPDMKIIIQGHTSASGTEEYNQKLSERRADTVKKFLMKEGGIAPDRLSAVGYGETRLEMPEPDPEIVESAAAKVNRRVIFEIVVK